MPIFLESHFKFQQLEARLNKNQYLSNQCLPNFIDAQVFKALKTSDKIPKRQIYPNFYHWYVLMRQFADRTLEMWMKNHQKQYMKDGTINEVVNLIKQIPEESNKTVQQNKLQIAIYTTKQPQNIKDSSTSQLRKQFQHDPHLQCPNNYVDIPKTSSNVQKKSKNQYDLVTEYIMDIKINHELNANIEKVKRLFDLQTQKIHIQYLFSVKLQSIRVINGTQDQIQGSDIRVYFLTVAHICEQLKNQILRCSNVQSIQCKKQKRNLSL